MIAFEGIKQVIAASLLALAITCAALLTPASGNTPGEAYNDAIVDAMSADADEIRPLVTVTSDCDMITWDESGERALMLSWHSEPEAFPAGETVTADRYDIWAFTDREIIAWYGENAADVIDWTLRLEQLLGLPEGCGYTHVSAFWCEPNDLIRPAYVTDVTKQLTPEALDGSYLGEWAEWFDANALFSYFDSAYPWTRLGYTYDWSGAEYGLTEFLVPMGGELQVEWTLTTDEFIGWLIQASA